ncbi:MAG: hypothetical protein DSZ24_07390 [Thermodesulfatator sp.]|nr:MAG: hypothetical protein DSZ24_07390 [Thermodesulfatator sp.]
MGNPFSSLARRLVLLNLPVYLSLGLFLYFFTWHLLSQNLRKELAYRLELLARDLQTSMSNIYFDWQVTGLKQGFPENEVLFLARKEALETLQKKAREGHFLYFVTYQGKKLAGNVSSPEEIVTHSIEYKRFPLTPFYWQVLLGIPLKDYQKAFGKMKGYFWTALGVLVLLSSAFTYLFYLFWVRKPLNRVVKALEERRPLPYSGLREVDLLVQRVQEAMKREEELFRQVAFSEKMSALGVLAGGYAHEFNNLLQVVAGFLELAQLHIAKGQTEAALKALEGARQKAFQGAELSRKLLRLARKSPDYGKESHPLDLMVKNTIDALSTAFPKDIQVSFEAESEGLHVPLSEEEIQEIVSNLLLNAVDALRGCGKVQVTLSQKGEEVELKIEDSGPGIPPELRTRIFEPFFTTKEVGKGTGLGLYVVHQIVVSKGGRIEVGESPLGGACFRVLLPRVEPRPEKKEKKETPKSPVSKEKILIVDDEKEIRENLQAFLRFMELEASLASGAEEALEQLRKEPYGVLFLDLLMPKHDGFWLLEQLEAQNLKFPRKIILMTGYAGELSARIEKWKTRAEVSILKKPFSLKEVKEILGRKV